MKIIEKLSERIDEELCDAKSYVKMAIECKEERRGLADVYNEISLQEMNHVNMLHEQVVEIITNYRKTNGEPPANMLSVYEYLHKKQIEKANRIKVYQDMYKSL